MIRSDPLSAGADRRTIGGRIYSVSSERSSRFIPRSAQRSIRTRDITALGSGSLEVFVSIALVSDSVWGLAAGTARQWLARKPNRLAQLGGAGGVAIVGLGVRLALTGRND